MEKMKVKKILNNNALLVTDNSKKELVAIGQGIGFRKKKNDLIFRNQFDKVFIAEGNEKILETIQKVPEEYFKVAEKIIEYAEKQLNVTLDERILLTLSDHISFAVERIKNGIFIKNKLLYEIEILYAQEFEIGIWGINLISNEFGIGMPIDEAGFIALQVHTMKEKGGNFHHTIRQTEIIKTMVDTIGEYLNAYVEKDSISFERLVAHLNFLLLRNKNDDRQVLDEEMNSLICKRYPLAYECAKIVFAKVKLKFKVVLPIEELGYLTIHVERIRERNSSK